MSGTTNEYIYAMLKVEERTGTVTCRSGEVAFRIGRLLQHRTPPAVKEDELPPISSGRHTPSTSAACNESIPTRKPSKSRVKHAPALVLAPGPEHGC